MENNPLEAKIQALTVIIGGLIGALRVKGMLSIEEIESLGGVMTPLFEKQTGVPGSAIWHAVLSMAELLQGDQSPPDDSDSQ